MARKLDTNQGRSFRLGFLLHDVSRLRRTVMDKALKPLSVTRSQWWVLTNLSRYAKPIMQTELASRLDIGKVALGGLLDRLEQAGYILRRPDPEDRRAKRVEMTETGVELLAAVQDRAATLNAEIMHNVTPAEILQVEDILHRMKLRLVEMDQQMRASGGEWPRTSTARPVGVETPRIDPPAAANDTPRRIAKG